MYACVCVFVCSSLSVFFLCVCVCVCSCVFSCVCVSRRAEQAAEGKGESVRDGLVQLRRMVRQGMGQAAQMTESAEESSQTLGWTLREWEEYGNEMDIGHVNISKLNSRRRTDTVLISLAFILYLGVGSAIPGLRSLSPMHSSLLPFFVFIS